MKRPKLTHYKRPMMFYQDARGLELDIFKSPRIRIVYPDGKAEWMTFALPKNIQLAFDCYVFSDPPCFMECDCNDNIIIRDIGATITLMNKYDKDQGFGRAEFLGYI